MTEAPAPARWRYRRSLASRVTLLTTMAVGLAVAFVALGAYATARIQLQDTLDDSLLSRAEGAADSPALQRLTVEGRFPAWALGAADVRIAFISVYSGEATSVDEGPPFNVGAPEFAVADGTSDYAIRTITAGDIRYRVVTVPAQTDGQALVLAQSLEPQEQVLRKLGVVTLLFGLAGVIAAAVAGMAVARSGLRPVRRLTGAVEEIARTERLDPIRVEGDDEIARLATSFNQMLVALEASRDRQRRLVADAGHELRTPLTSLRTNIELLGQSDADPDGGFLPPEARAELLDDVAAQIEELTTLIGDLVELARDDPMAHVVEPVELTEVLEQALARVRRRAPGIDFEVAASPWTVEGESGAIERAMTNLLDNAAKWSPPAGAIHVSLAEGVLVVDDEGPGIPEADLAKVFERFWRSEESRAMPGSGLGLSIVHQTAERHSGSVRAERSPYGGARLVLQLPGRP
ncbi:HAMP domain-containing sensor histidine kinase [Nocardioides sp. P86]|uniref:HAMP domain-containing sensor histidine kinase n=1 Tax=Nocardioides sp. P86 TaxID=2939569 RepID=UPI00203D8F79|nr:HAMP domain-containing sensor histidine kinase [Nocardioides sp. P86]MCM3516298.1 HAMP domain-containing histidine kinase [Nocardioides sp. P86]